MVRLIEIGKDERAQDGVFSYVSLEQRVPPEIPLRAIAAGGLSNRVRGKRLLMLAALVFGISSLGTSTKRASMEITTPRLAPFVEALRPALPEDTYGS